MKHLLVMLFMGSLAVGSAPAAGPRVRLIAVQMKADTGSYRNLSTFRKTMDALIGEAAKRKAATCPTLVALPEDTGLGLIFLGQMDTVKGATTIREAGDLLGRKMAAQVMGNVMAHNVSPTRALLLAANDGWLRAAYYDTFSALARKYGVYLAAGSAPLSKPGSADVHNVAILFGPDGEVLNETSKVHLIELEGAAGLDLTPGRIEDLKVAATPFGKVGTAVCWDGFHDDVLDALTHQGAEFILQPSYNPGPWTKDEEANWGTGLWTRLKTRPGVKAGVNPMMVGGLWDVICEGQSNIVGAAAPPNGYFGRARSAQEPSLVLVDR
jgi:hypothetical protein